MARSISWLSRLHDIRRSVADSVRSHYTRTELETLFQVQQRTASRLLEVLPTVPVGTNHVVSREHLTAFLDRMRDAEDPHALLDRMREEKTFSEEKKRTWRRKIRSLVRHDIEPVTLASVPLALHLEPGKLEIRFETVTEMVQSLRTLALVLDNDLEEFVRRYEPKPAGAADEDATELRAMFAELEEMEASHR